MPICWTPPRITLPERFLARLLCSDRALRPRPNPMIQPLKSSSSVPVDSCPSLLSELCRLFDRSDCSLVRPVIHVGGIQLLSDFNLPEDLSSLLRNLSRSPHCLKLQSLPRRPLHQSKPPLQTGRLPKTTMSTGSMLGRRGSAEVARSARRIGKCKNSYRTGMISTIRLGQTIMRNTSIATSR